MIPDHIKEHVKSSADIVEVISDYVKLRRSGNSFVGLCPFHSEKTPSFNVSPQSGFFKCFGCGESGDVFSFLMKKDGVSFTEAIRIVGARFGIDVPEENEPVQDEQYRLKEGIFHALSFAGKFFFKQLTKSDEGSVALKYLEKRGFTHETIRSYGLGFAPDSFDALLKAATDVGIKEEYLEQGGLIKYARNGESAYDTFRNRLMFPIFNASGKVIGFGGRVIAGSDGKSPKNAPKYINSSQTPVYNKSEVLYGIHVAKNEIRKTGETILVEGYTDVISMHQAGIKNVVATSGTALTIEQLRAIGRYGENLLMIYDADLAGQNAMSRGIDLALKQGLNVRLLQLPDGEDPDSFVKKSGRDAFLEYREAEAKDFVYFSIEKAKKENRWNDPFHRKNVLHQILLSIAQIPELIIQETFIQHLSEATGLGTVALFDQLKEKRAELRETAERQKIAEKRQEQYAQRTTAVEAGSPQPGLTSPTESPPFPDDDPFMSADNTYFDDPAFFPGSGPATTRPGRERGQTIPTITRPPAYEKELLRLMLSYGHPMVEYVGSQCNEEHFMHPPYRELFADLVQRYNEGKPISVSLYMEPESGFQNTVGEIVMELYAPSSGAQQKRGGKKLDRDGKPYKTAKGELRLLQMEYLGRVLDNFRQLYLTAETQEEKSKYNEIVMQVSRERTRFMDGVPDELFPNPEDV